jgi:LmbE family N-acetylglucosaminyl deacetylase
MRISVLLCTALGCGSSSITVDAPLNDIDAAVAALTFDQILADSRAVLYVGAHPDDENAVGAALARAREAAGTLYMVSLTRGENARTYDCSGADPGGVEFAGHTRGSDVGAVRADLFAASALGFLATAEAGVGGFVDGPFSLDELNAMSPTACHEGWDSPGLPGDIAAVRAKWAGEGDPVAYLVERIRLWRPDTIITWDAWCGASGNDEHKAVSAIVTDAVAAAGDAALYPGLGQAYSVGYLLQSAKLEPILTCDGCRAMGPSLGCSQCATDCTLCAQAKCEGAEPSFPLISVDGRRQSALFGESEFKTACRVALVYVNAAQSRGWDGAAIASLCTDLDAQVANDPSSAGLPTPGLVGLRVVQTR